MINRRGFFRAGAGAAVAAPVAMKQVAGGLIYTAPHSLGLGSIGATAVGGDSDWMKKDLAQYTAQLAGLNETKPLHERDFYPVIAQRIDGMRSVSAVNKARMMVEAREVHERLNQRTWMQKRIDEIKERLGPLGGLL
jgi:hypothetical protein